MKTTAGERRISERVQSKLEARWEGVLTSRTGTVVDVSTTGCFILTQDDVQPGELVRLEIKLQGEQRIYLWGEVVYRIEEMGFALRFTGTEESEQRMLERLLEYLLENRGGSPAMPDSTPPNE
ncbi:MAG: PilZ domain-containing protein [Acidobacteria bacterium]|nr:PilZ domain-containing protein [Acidobacteriota bacterium]